MPTDVSVNPIAPWLGGKRNLAKRICAIIDQDKHDTYAEPFVGMGGIFLRRKSAAKSELINDKHREIYTLFRVLQEHYVAFLDLLRFQITTQANFARLVATDPNTLTDMQRAARFLYLQRCSFGGKVTGQTFGLSPDRSARFNLTTLERDLEALHTRLAGVTVMNIDCAEFISRVDRKTALFYLDPPYWGHESDYGPDVFDRDRFEQLAQLLSGMNGRFLLSINDVPEIRALFAWAEVHEVQTTYTAGLTDQSRGKRAELLIGNFEFNVPR
nr:DNA adenine methylase [uncultured Tateyamaria sp.]